ncbi:glycoside hydrolase family 5 [Priestia aryabhattai]|nr:glycoside hydrolase family 5 [Priestia aryabhattai]
MYFIKLITISVIAIMLITCCTYFPKKTPENSSKQYSDVSRSMGVNINGKITKQDIQDISTAGFKWVRMDIYWESVEPVKGKYDFTKNNYDKINSWLREYNIKPYYILDYSNKLYERKRSITSSEGRKAFLKFVQMTVKRYNNQNAIWEVWNEPNHPNFWNEVNSYNNYAKLLKSVYPVIKKYDPTGLVVGPALSGIHDDSLNWLKNLFQLNVLQYVDAISVHPYRYNNPETVIIDYKKLNRLVKHYTKKKIPILSGEWGYSMTEPSMKIQMSEMKQAQYFTRTMLINISQNIHINIWYNWKNTGDNPSDREHNFGVMWYDSTPKLTYLASQVLATTLKDYNFVKRVDQLSNEDYVLEFKNSEGKKALVFWTTKENHTINISMKNKNGTVVSMLGAKRKIKIKDKLQLKLFSSPNYLLIE